MKQNSLIKTILSWPYTIWIVTAIAAFIFLFIGIEHESMWVDEAFSAGFVQHNLVQITHYTFNDVHPPLYYYILKLFGSIFGSSVIALRFASLIGALAFVGLGAGPVKRLFGFPRQMHWIFSKP